MTASYFDGLGDPTACTVRYSRLDREPRLRVYPNLRVFDEHVVAALLGCEPERLREIRSALDSVLNLACDELFAGPGFGDSIRSLPLASDDVVVAVGDSITADALSWMELLVLALRRAGRVGPEVINTAISSVTNFGLDRQLRIRRLEKPKSCDRHDRDERRPSAWSGSEGPHGIAE